LCRTVPRLEFFATPFSGNAKKVTYRWIMAGSLWSPFREGNRSEYLAQYFLSALGVSVNVPRPEDIGIDFYCALAQETGKRLTFHSPFAVQVGSYGTKQFCYGGYTDKGAWRKEQLHWLFSQELPLFVCTIGKEDLSFRLYSTSPMWLIRYSYGDVSEVHLVPDATHDIFKESREEVPAYAGKGGDGCVYRIPLGPPIVALRIEDLKSNLVNKARLGLAKAARAEMLNLTYRRLNAHFAQWLLDIVSNDDSGVMKLGHLYAWNSEPGRNTREQLKALVPIVVALAHNLKSQKRFEELALLRGIFQLIPKEDLPAFVEENIPELF
jgi:hypothetical protein